MVDRLDEEVAGVVDTIGSPTEENLKEVVEFSKEFAEKIESLDV